MNGTAESDQAWRQDGGLWWPVESADGRQRFDGQRWVAKRRGFRVLQVFGWLLLGLSPVALLAGFGIIGGHPAYPGQPPVSGGPLVFAYACMLIPAPVGLVAVLVASRQLGRPGLGTENARVRWVWQSPPGWPEPPSDWTPSPGWRPDSSWPEPPAEWRGWVRRRR